MTAAEQTRPLYDAVNAPVLERVGKQAQRVLDVGCGTGELGRALKSERPGLHVTGITISAAEAERARQVLDEVLVADLNDFTFPGLGPFDVVVCSHVLEHLVAPEVVLRRLRPTLSPSGSLLVALPNALHWRQRLEFLRGRFRYEDQGVMDRTHLRFFDWDTARELVRASGYSLDSAEPDGAFPASRLLGRWGRRFDRPLLEALPGVLARQFIFLARPA